MNLDKISDSYFPLIYNKKDATFYILKKEHAQLWARDLKTIDILNDRLNVKIAKDSLDNFNFNLLLGNNNTLTNTNASLVADNRENYKYSMDLFANCTETLTTIPTILEENRQLKKFKTTTLGIGGSGIVFAILLKIFNII